MSKVVLITGSSSGIGRETADYFACRGWKVVATMRNPPEKWLGSPKATKNIDITRLDVLDIESIRKAVQFALDRHGRIDVVVNNAGYSLAGDFESSTREQIERQIRTNLMGLIDVTKEVVPLFKSKGCGTIINVSSIAGRVAIPRFSIYNCTKWGVEGFSEAIYHELRPHGIRVKIIEPGIIDTDFYGRSMDVAGSEGAKDPGAQATKESGQRGSPPVVIAKVIFKAATSRGNRLRYGAGKMHASVVVFRKLLPEGLFLRLVARMSKKM